MEAAICSIFAFGIFGGFGFLIYLLILVVKRSGRLNQSFRAAAVTMKGNFVQGGVWKRPRISLRYGNTAARLRILKKAGGDETELTVNWPAGKQRFEMHSRVEGMTFRRADWTQVDFGHESLDMALVLKAENPQGFSRLLSDGVKWQLERLLTFLPHQRFYCGCLRRELVLRKTGLIKNNAELVQFVRFGLELYDQFQLTQVDGIDFVESQEATLLDQIHCPVCGEPIESRLVICVDCKTPHHQECWEYNGRCATFACGQEVFSKPAVARPIEDPRGKGS